MADPASRIGIEPIEFPVNGEIRSFGDVGPCSTVRSGQLHVIRWQQSQIPPAWGIVPMSKPQGISAEFDKIRADCDMSRQSRFIRRRTGVAPQGGSADYHYRTESKYYDDMEQALDMDRNDSLVCTLADRRVDNIVQHGFSLDVKTGDYALDTDLEARLQDYAGDPEQ